MMNTNVDPLINEATKYLHEQESILKELLEISAKTDDLSDEEKVLTIQLILQYRLSSEDALGFLLKMDHNLLYFLGIQPQQSGRMNVERLAYAIGNEDLKQILNVLAILTGSLSKIVARYKENHASFTLKSKEHSILSKVATKLITKQKQFLTVLNKLHLEIEQLVKLQAAGPVFDHIAALRGPISQFHQAIAHGLGQAEQLYHQINKKPVIDYQLHSLLKKTDEVLHVMPSLYNPHPTSSPMTAEKLEQRAAAKRLRPFFG